MGRKNAKMERPEGVWPRTNQTEGANGQEPRGEYVALRAALNTRVAAANMLEIER